MLNLSSCFVAPQELCQTETFTPSCPQNQVVVLTEARFGRLRRGRCVEVDYGNLGCNASVIDLVSRPTDV